MAKNKGLTVIFLLLQSILGQRMISAECQTPEAHDPGCELPTGLAGMWVFSEDTHRDVFINETHIQSMSGSEKELLTCTTRVGDRYLMSVTTADNCDANYTCVDLTLRDENFIDMLRSQSYALAPGELDAGSSLICNSQSVPYMSNDTEWEEYTLISTSPKPVDCPIKGHYLLLQHGADEEQYKVADRNGSNEEVASRLESCQDNPGKLIMGRANSSDTRELTCVGDWTKGTNSYLVTYDELDTDSQFRCWVYHVSDEGKVMLSKATGAVCDEDHTAHSHAHLPGVSLHLVLDPDPEMGPCWEQTDVPPISDRSSVLMSSPAMMLGFAILVTGANWYR